VLGEPSMRARYEGHLPAAAEPAAAQG
jgi:hypothetical protein